MKRDYRSSIYKVGKKSGKVEGWRLDFFYKDKDDSNKIKSHKPRFDTKREAEDFLEKLVEDYKNQKIEGYKNQTGIFAPKVKAKPEKLTFRDYVENTYFPELLNSTMKTAHSSKKSEVKLLIEYFGDNYLEDITDDDTLEFKSYIENLPVSRQHKIREKVFNPESKRWKWKYSYETRETPRAVSTSNHYLKRLQAIMNKAFRRKKVATPVIFENFVDTGNEAVRAITINFEQHQALLDACVGIRAHLRLILTGLFETGARMCELKAVQKKDLNLETQFGWFLNSKRRRNSPKTWRKVYISNRLKDELLADGFADLADDDFLFSPGNNKNAWSKAKRNALENLAARGKELFDKTLTMKDFRHTHYTNLLESDISESVADRQIAHGLHEKITRRVYGNALRDDYIFSVFQRYEEFSRRERAKLKKSASVAA
jgi:integrase